MSFDIAEEIREKNKTTSRTALSTEYGMSYGGITDIVTNKSWRPKKSKEDELKIIVKRNKIANRKQSGQIEKVKMEKFIGFGMLVKRENMVSRIGTVKRCTHILYLIWHITKLMIQ